MVLSATCQGAEDVAAAHNLQNHDGIQLRPLQADTTGFRFCAGSFLSSQPVTQLHACIIMMASGWARWRLTLCHSA